MRQALSLLGALALALLLFWGLALMVAPPEPREVLGMLNGQSVELTEGYHRRAFVCVGELGVLTTFDKGSFQNAIKGNLAS